MSLLFSVVRDIMRTRRKARKKNRVEWTMLETSVRDDETIESALRRFRRMCNQSGLMSELRRRAHYEKPSDAKRREMKKRLRKERR